MIFGKISGGAAGATRHMAGMLLATTACAIGMTVPVTPAFAQSIIRYDIPAGSLPTALNSFARLAHVELIYDATLTQGVFTSGLKGGFGTAEGLSRLLSGSAIVARQTGPRMFTLERAPVADTETTTGAVKLGTVRVEAKAIDDAGGNLRGESRDPIARRLNPATIVGSKTPVRQRELPQSISIITQDRIESQNLFNLEDAIRETPGLVVRTGDAERFQFYARGFPVDQVQYDGIPTANANSATSPSLLMYERVEVLRGPTGLYNGVGGEGGSINLVRKRAPETLAASVSISAGSRNNYRGVADLGGQLNASGTIRARGAISYQDQDLVADTTYRKDFQIFGTLEADLDEDTTIRVGLAKQELRQRASWMGYPVYADYGFIGIPRSRYLGQSWHRNIYRTTTEYAELAHETSVGWTFKVTTNFMQHRNDLATSSIDGPVDRASGDFPMQKGASKWDEDQYGVDTFASGPFTLFGRTHNLTLGTNYQSYIEDQSGFNGENYLNNIFTPVIVSAPPTPPNASIYRKYAQYGAYANLRVSLFDALTLIMGGRISWVKSRFNYHFTFADFTYRDKYKAKSTPFAGLVLDISPTLTAYTSYAQVFTPQFSRDANDTIFRPITGNQAEIGIKGEYLDGRLNMSAALFRIIDRHRAKEDPRFPGQFISIAQGNARSEGLELQLSGEVARGLIILAGYTYTRTKYEDDSRNPNGDFETFAPKHLLKVQADYTLPGKLDRWSVGGGVQAQSKTLVYDIYGGGTVTQGSYATVDLRTTYKPTDRIAISLTGTNIFDRRYWSTLGGIYGGNFLGNPATVIASVRWKY